MINVEITPVWGESSGQILERINQDVNAGVDDYDAAFLSISTAMTAAQNGNTLNFNDVSSFDASHEWWNQRLLEDCTFFGEDVYCCSRRSESFGMTVRQMYCFLTKIFLRKITAQCLIRRFSTEHGPLMLL